MNFWNKKKLSQCYMYGVEGTLFPENTDHINVDEMDTLLRNSMEDDFG